MKKCPFCAESIQEEAIKCRYCQSFLSGAAGTGATEPEAVSAADAAPASEAEAAAANDGWESVAPEKKAASERNRGGALGILKPAVSGATSVPSAPAKDDGPISKRRVLYSGSPSWRAFFNHYAAVVLAALIVPFITVWIAGLFGAGGFAKFLSVAIPLLLCGVAFLAINVYRKSSVFRITTTNIESEYGILSKKIDVLELWRCRDVRYQQSLMDRILRIAHIEVMTADVTTPQLCINGLPASRQLFEKIRDSIEIQRQARNVVGFVQ